MNKTKPQYRGLIGAGFVLVAVLAGGVLLINAYGSDDEGSGSNPLAPLARAFGLAPKDFSPPPITSPIPDYHRAAGGQGDHTGTGVLGGVLEKVDLKDVFKTKEQMRQSAQESVGAIIGPAQVVDGDTLDVAGQRIRLYGIDAPEMAQTCIHATGEWDCGRRAALWLQQLISNNPVACQSKGEDRYGRVVATCTMGDADIAAELVRNGWAVAYRSITKTYVITEGDARRKRLGLWDSQFTMPWDFRKEG